MIYLLLIIELIHEARYGDKHDLNSVVRLAFMFLIANLWGVLQSEIYLAAIYVLVRFAIFDISIAILRGHEWYYLGNTSAYDRFLKKFNRYLLLSLRVVAITTALIYEFI